MQIFEETPPLGVFPPYIFCDTSLSSRIFVLPISFSILYLTFLRLSVSIFYLPIEVVRSVPSFFTLTTFCAVASLSRYVARFCIDHYLFSSIYICVSPTYIVSSCNFPIEVVRLVPFFL